MTTSQISLKTAGILSVWLEVRKLGTAMHIRILTIFHLLQTFFYGANIVELGIYTSLFFKTVFIMFEQKAEDLYGTIKGMHCHSTFR